MMTSHLMSSDFFMIKMLLYYLCYNFLTITEKPWQNMFMIKPLRHCKIQDTKKLKRKPSIEKFGADFQRQPITDVFLSRCS